MRDTFAANNSTQPLVTMITYCYNGERFVHKYFEAILAQTYENIELIFFNNGSEDNTGEIAEKYKTKLENRGIKVNLIHYKENQNTCELKIKGFEIAKGELMFGCDSDDCIHPTYIEEMAGYLIEHPEKGIVFCQLNVIQEETGQNIGMMKIQPKEEDKEQFIDILNARNTMFTAISYMMRKSMFIDANRGIDFALSTYGENYQIQIPLLYNNLQGYIEKPLGDYAVRYDSYSVTLGEDYLKQIQAYEGQEKAIIETLNRIEIDDFDYYASIVKKRLRRDGLYAAIWLGDSKIMRDQYNRLKEVNGVSFKDSIAFHFSGLYKAIKRNR